MNIPEQIDQLDLRIEAQTQISEELNIRIEDEELQRDNLWVKLEDAWKAVTG